MTTLDAALGLDAGEAVTLARPCLLKVDVQGAELLVLRGASRALAQVDQVLVECEFEAIYVGQPRPAEVVALLAAHGLHFTGVHSPTYAADGRCLQADLLFTRG